MPVYKVENFLADSINSVLNQSYSNFELILVDDCSPDNSPAICDEYAQKDNRIKVIHLKENGGLGNARNNGMDKAVGEYILFLDSDDTIDENLFELLVNSLDENLAQVIIFGLIEEYYDKNGSICKTKPISYNNKQLKTSDEVRNEIVSLENSTLYGYAWNKLYNLEYLRSRNIEFTKMRFNEDIIFNISVFMEIESCNILSITPYHYAKRMNSSITSKFIPSYYKDIMLKIDRLYEQFETWDMLTPETLKMIASRYSRYFFSALQRNLDKRMNMDKAQRIRFFEDELKSERYVRLNAYLGGGGLSGIMAKAFKAKNRLLCFGIVGVINFIKTNFPQIFEKIN